MKACPICRSSPVIDDMCPASCGSLEGIEDSSNNNDNNRDVDGSMNQRPKKRMFGFAWSKGYVAPFLGVNAAAARDALVAAGVSSTSTTTMVDLGCGDGRICHIAAELGATKAVGYDLDTVLIDKAQQQAKDLPHHTERLSFFVGDLFQVDLQPFTLVTVFLLPDTLSDQRLVRQFRNVLDRGGRVVSFGWRIPLLGEPVGCNDKLHLDGSIEEYSGLVKQWFLYKQ